ncbi:MAG: glycosyltransferase [Bacilli bacterium]
MKSESVAVLQPLTSIIIPTYNQWTYTRQCIESIHRFTTSPYELIVVDNGSNDETVAELRAYKEVILIENPVNFGFPKACNQGMEAARGEQFVILNNDVVVTHNWLDNLLSCLHSDPSHGAVGPVSNYVSGVQFYPGSYTSMEEMQQFSLEHNKPNPSKWFYTLRLVGFCLVIRRSVYEILGGFDEDFGQGNFEDDDYCLRIRRSGRRLVVAADTFVHHYGSVSQRVNPNYGDLLQSNLQRFFSKWGINPQYSLWTREDLAELIPQDVTRVLDVGCACGGLGLTLKNRGVGYVAGIEYNERAAIDARTVLDEVWIGDAATIHLPHPPGSFDALVFADVLEHLTDPIAALRNLTSYLKPEGYVVASIPNVGHASVLKGLLEGSWTYQESGILDKTHLRFFTLLEIARLFEQAGLQIEFIGMVQDAPPDLDTFCMELEQLAARLQLPSFGPGFRDRCNTVQYYVRALKVS